MQNKFFTVLLIFFSSVVLGQVTYDEEPQFPGGDSMMYKFVKRNRKLPIAIDEKVSCTINQNGFIINPVVLSDKKSKEDSVAQREALRLVKIMPQWVPATSNGKTISKKIIIQVKYDMLRPPMPPLKNKEYDPELEAHVAEAEVMPEYPGGNDAMTAFIKENLKYPDSARANELQGKVIVRFIVKADGSLKNIQVYRGIGSDCNKEAVRLVKSMPKWKPGTQNGKEIDVDTSVVVVFNLLQ